MAEMVERLAKRLAAVDWAASELKDSDKEILLGDRREYVRDNWHRFVNHAEGVLEELFEPTEHMAFHGRNSIARGDRLRIRADKAIDAYRAMIGAALQHG